jgi:hypothetical protein
MPQKSNQSNQVHNYFNLTYCTYENQLFYYSALQLKEYVSLEKNLRYLCQKNCHTDSKKVTPYNFSMNYITFTLITFHISSAFIRSLLESILIPFLFLNMVLYVRTCNTDLILPPTVLPPTRFTSLLLQWDS